MKRTKEAVSRRQTMRFFLRLIVFIAIAPVLFFGGISWWIQGADKPSQADLIVVLSGAYSRSFYAASLFAERYAPEVWISQPKVPRVDKMIDDLGVLHPHEPIIHTAILAKQGVPVSKIRLYGPDVDSTVDEALALRRELGDTTKKLLVVTSCYHVRRSRIILEHYLPHALIEVVATPYDETDPRWWRHKDLAENAILEPFKMGYYLFAWVTGSLPLAPPAAPSYDESAPTSRAPKAGAVPLTRQAGEGH